MKKNRSVRQNLYINSPILEQEQNTIYLKICQSSVKNNDSNKNINSPPHQLIKNNNEQIKRDNKVFINLSNQQVSQISLQDLGINNNKNTKKFPYHKNNKNKSYSMLQNSSHIKVQQQQQNITKQNGPIRRCKSIKENKKNQNIIYHSLLKNEEPMPKLNELVDYTKVKNNNHKLNKFDRNIYLSCKRNQSQVIKTQINQGRMKQIKQSFIKCNRGQRTNLQHLNKLKKIHQQNMGATQDKENNERLIEQMRGCFMYKTKVDPIDLYQIKNNLAEEGYKKAPSEANYHCEQYSSHYVISNGEIYIRNGLNDYNKNTFQSISSEQNYIPKQCNTIFENQEGKLKNNKKRRSKQSMSPFVSIAHFEHESEVHLQSTKNVNQNIKKFSIKDSKVQQVSQSKEKTQNLCVWPQRKPNEIYSAFQHSFSDIQKKLVTKQKKFIAAISGKQFTVFVHGVHNYRQFGQRKIYNAICTHISFSNNCRVNGGATANNQNIINQIRRKDQTKRQSIFLRFSLILDSNAKLNSSKHEGSNRIMFYQVQLKRRDSITNSKFDYLRQKLFLACLTANITDFVKYLTSFIGIIVILKGTNGMKLMLLCPGNKCIHREMASSTQLQNQKKQKIRTIKLNSFGKYYKTGSYKNVQTMPQIPELRHIGFIKISQKYFLYKIQCFIVDNSTQTRKQDNNGNSYFIKFRVEVCHQLLNKTANLPFSDCNQFDDEGKRVKIYCQHHRKIENFKNSLSSNKEIEQKLTIINQTWQLVQFINFINYSQIKLQDQANQSQSKIGKLKRHYILINSVNSIAERLINKDLFGIQYDLKTCQQQMAFHQQKQQECTSQEQKYNIKIEKCFNSQPSFKYQISKSNKNIKHQKPKKLHQNSHILKQSKSPHSYRQGQIFKKRKTTIRQPSSCTSEYQQPFIMQHRKKASQFINQYNELNISHNLWKEDMLLNPNKDRKSNSVKNKYNEHKNSQSYRNIKKQSRMISRKKIKNNIQCRSSKKQNKLLLHQFLIKNKHQIKQVFNNNVVNQVNHQKSQNGYQFLYIKCLLDSIDIYETQNNDFQVKEDGQLTEYINLFGQPKRVKFIISFNRQFRQYIFWLPFNLLQFSQKKQMISKSATNICQNKIKASSIKQNIENTASKLKKYSSFMSYQYRLTEPVFQVLYKKIKKLSTRLFVIVSLVYSQLIKVSYVKIYASWLQRTFYFKITTQRFIRINQDWRKDQNQREWQNIAQTHCRILRNNYFKQEIEDICKRVKYQNQRIFQENIVNQILNPTNYNKNKLPSHVRGRSNRKQLCINKYGQDSIIIHENETILYENIANSKMCINGSQFLIHIFRDFRRELKMSEINKNIVSYFNIQIFRFNKFAKFNFKFKQNITKQVSESQTKTNNNQDIYFILRNSLNKKNITKKEKAIIKYLYDSIEGQGISKFGDIIKRLKNNCSNITQRGLNLGVISTQMSVHRKRLKNKQIFVERIGGSSKKFKNIMVVDQQIKQLQLLSIGFGSTIPINKYNKRLIDRLIRFYRDRL